MPGIPPLPMLGIPMPALIGMPPIPRAAVAASGGPNYIRHGDVSLLGSEGQRFGAVELSFKVIDQYLLTSRRVNARRDRIHSATGVADHGGHPRTALTRIIRGHPLTALTAPGLLRSWGFAFRV
jgi:hypothetical protein